METEQRGTKLISHNSLLHRQLHEVFVLSIFFFLQFAVNFSLAFHQQSNVGGDVSLLSNQAVFGVDLDLEHGKKHADNARVAVVSHHLGEGVFQSLADIVHAPRAFPRYISLAEGTENLQYFMRNS